MLPIVLCMRESSIGAAGHVLVVAFLRRLIRAEALERRRPQAPDRGHLPVLDPRNKFGVRPVRIPDWFAEPPGPHRFDSAGKGALAALVLAKCGYEFGQHRVGEPGSNRTKEPQFVTLVSA